MIILPNSNTDTFEEDVLELSIGQIVAYENTVTGELVPSEVIACDELFNTVTVLPLIDSNVIRVARTLRSDDIYTENDLEFLEG